LHQLTSTFLSTNQPTEQNMTATKNKSIGLTVLALSFVLGMPAFAQPATGKPMSPPQAMGMEHKGPMHHEFREEMEKMHKEQADLDAAREKLMDKCMHVSKEQAPACKTEREELRVRAEKLRAERKAMHEKMETMHKERMEQREEHMKDGMGSGGMMKAAPPATEAPAKP
jgi:hypothetical protein